MHACKYMYLPAGSPKDMLECEAVSDCEGPRVGGGEATAVKRVAIWCAGASQGVLRKYITWRHHLHTPCFAYVTVFAKRDHFGANLDFDFCIRHERTLDELSVALYCTSLAGFGSEILLHKVWNYAKCVIKKTALKHLLPVKPQHSAFFRVTEHQVSFATLSVTWAPSWLHAASLDTSGWLWWLYYTAEMVSGTLSWVLLWFMIAMNTLRTGSFPVYPYMLLYTVSVTFPMYSVHEQNDLGSETVRSSFDSQESSTSLKLGLKVGDTRRFQWCNNLWLHKMLTSREFSPVSTCLHCPQMVPFRKYCHINETLVLGQSPHVFTQYSNHLPFAHKLDTGNPSLGPHHWRVAPPRWVFQYSSAPYYTWQHILWLVGMRSPLLLLPVVWQNQYQSCCIAHDWRVTVGQRYTEKSLCTHMHLFCRLQPREELSSAPSFM